MAEPTRGSVFLACVLVVALAVHSATAAECPAGLTCVKGDDFVPYEAGDANLL